MAHCKLDHNLPMILVVSIIKSKVSDKDRELRLMSEFYFGLRKGRKQPQQVSHGDDDDDGDDGVLAREHCWDQKQMLQ